MTLQETVPMNATKSLDNFLGELRQLGIKLWVEGDRLRYRAPEGTLTPELLAELKVRKAEILGFLQQLHVANAKQATIVPVPRTGPLPISYTQQRIWLQAQLEPNSALGNIPNIYRLKGQLDLDALNRAQNEVVRRHEILRSTFAVVDRQPQIEIASTLDLPIPIVDLQHLSPPQQEQDAQRLADEEAQRPFDLAHDPLIRLKLLRFQPNEHILSIVVHRIACDGASFDVFFRELLALYRAFVEGQPSPLPQLSIQYLDYAAWQNQWLQSDALNVQLGYWKQQLGGDLPPLQLPTDHPRPPVQTYRGARHYRLLPKALNQELNALSQRAGATLFMTLLAAFNVLLHRYSGQDDLLVSFTNAGRTQEETETLIGPFSNTLVLRTQLSGSSSFVELLDRVRRSALEAYTHQDLPFERVIDEVRTDRRGRSPLFQVLFALNPPWTGDRALSVIELPKLIVESLFGYVYIGETKFDLTLVMRETDQGLRVVFEHNAELFEHSTISRMLDYFQTLLEGIVANPHQAIGTLPLLKPDEQHQILIDWNQTAVNYPTTDCIHQGFEAQAERTPDAVAAIAGEQQLTYRELNQRANQLAHYLQAQGIGTETLVVLCVERSLNLLVGILGVLKAGGAYIPIDPTYPHKRRAAKLQDAKASLILTQKHLVPLVLEYGTPVVSIDGDWQTIEQHSTDNPVSTIAAENLAYVIYTSGSTGEPKGVMITHQGLMNHSIAVGKAFELSPCDRVLQFSNISFDVAAEELFPTWLYGGTVVLSPADIHASTTHFFKSIEQLAITVLNLPTAFWHELVNGVTLLNQPLPPTLRLVIVGGEKVSKSAYRDWRSRVGTFPRWLNAYGPTETTITATLYDPMLSEIELAPDAEIPIGRAIANVKTYVLNPSLQPCPIGVPGQLYIGGAGLSRGYLNRPGLSATRFIPNPFSSDPAARLYKTGDLVRYLPDGNLEFLGRSDFQIKLRGFRIEPIEIETQLEQYPAIQQAIVLCRDKASGDQFLVAYVVPQSDQNLDPEEIQRFLKQKLPAYMLPSSYVVLDAFPVTPNGKIDRQALPDPEQSLGSNPAPVTYRNDIEQQLTEIWEKTLCVQPIGVQDNFFHLGGHSLLAVRMFAQIEETFGKSLPLAMLLQAPTIEQLASVIRQEDHSTAWSPLVEIQTQGTKPPLFCVHGGGFNVLVYRHLSVHLGDDQPVYALQARGLDGNQPIINRLEEMAADYVQEIQKIQPEGPYFLSGLSNGGNIALEMAQQLLAQGQQVALVVMFDSFGPNSIKLLPPFPRFLSSVHYAVRYNLPRLVTRLVQPDAKSVLIGLQKVTKRLQRSQPSTLEQPNPEPSEPVLPTAESKSKGWVHAMNRFSQYILDHSTWSFLTPSAQLRGLDDAVSQRLKQLEETYSKVHKAYVPKPYPGKIVLFRATELPPGYWLDSKLGWSNIPRGGLEVYRVPGYHISIMGSPLLAKRMRACLDQAIAAHHGNKQGQ